MTTVRTIALIILAIYLILTTGVNLVGYASGSSANFVLGLGAIVSGVLFLVSCGHCSHCDKE